MEARQRSLGGLRSSHAARGVRGVRGVRSSCSSKAVSAPPEKRAKVDKFANGIIEAIRQADCLNVDCRAMLTAAVPWLLRRVRSGAERHGLQACAEAWITETLHSVQEQLHSAVLECDSQVAEVESERRDLEGKVAQAQAALRVAEKAADTAQLQAASSLDSSEAAKGRLVEAQRARRRGESSLALALKDKQRLDDIIIKHFAPLKGEDAFGVVEVERYAKVLAPLAEDLGLDASLQAALPMSLRRPPGERDAFELSALEQLGTALHKRAVELARVAEANNIAVAELGKTEAMVHMEYNSSDEAQKAAAQSARDARVHRRKLAAAASDAQARLAASEERLAATRTAREEKVNTLREFRSYNMACLDVLQGKAVPARAASASAEA